ncbi:MAG: ABC transporter permease, partial [Saprospiraceae bacterium]|nr:ABC transporter permease [Saprospiraceae bacterium]
MIKYNMKVALRNLRKHKFFSFLNILGLALSMSVSLIIITVVRNQYGYDRFHPAPERTYRIITEALRKNGGSEKYASTPYPLGTAIKEDFALAETLTQLSRGPGGDAET